MNWLRRIMYGRSGVDQLSIALVILGLVLSVIARAASLNWLYWISWAPLIYAYFRIFSRDIYKRRSENEWFLRYWYRVKNVFTSARGSAIERQTHRYYNCPQCKQKLRVPRGKGRINIRCPKCGTEFIKKT